jgi:hypothetical protein
MSLMKFFQTIDKSYIGKFIDTRLKLIESTDPERIYVENVRSFYNLPNSIAKIFCEMAVVENLFEKFYAVECPDESCGRIIATYKSLIDIPEIIECDQCEILERSKHEFRKGEFKVIEFYKLNKELR